MNPEKKFQAVKTVWEDIESPAWHKDVLRKREQRFAAGEVSFMDWEQAKVDIRSRLHLRAIALEDLKRDIVTGLDQLDRGQSAALDMAAIKAKARKRMG